MPSHVRTHNLTDSLLENFLCLSINMITNVSLLPVTCPVEFMWPKTTQRFMVHAKLMGHQHLQSICPIIATMDISSTVTGKLYFFPFLLSTSWNFSHFCDEFAPITTGNIPSVDILWFYEVTKLEDSSSVTFFFFFLITDTFCSAVRKSCWRWSGIPELCYSWNLKAWKEIPNI